MAGGAIDDAERRHSTPRTELARIREDRAAQDSALRDRVMEAVLEACGERGFRAATVQDAIDRYGGNRVQFYRLFAGKADAYEAAHAAALDALCERLLGAARAAEGWRPGLRAALAELGGFLVERPAPAKGLLVEVHIAGPVALAKRAEVHQRLAAAIDSARREPAAAATGPPPLTAGFMLGAVDSAATSALAQGAPARFAAAAPELAHMIVAAYFGEEAAAEELARASGD